MTIELEFDAKVEVRFFLSLLPVELMEALGQEKRALYTAARPPDTFGSEGACEIEAAGKRFLVFVRLGSRFVGEGQIVRTVRVLHIVENTISSR